MFLGVSAPKTHSSSDDMAANHTQASHVADPRSTAGGPFKAIALVCGTNFRLGEDRQRA